MSYVRGDYYLWADGANRLHIWACDGADHWRESGWGESLPAPDQAGGVSLPEAILDQYVVMRFAELMETGAVAETIERALVHGNFGGDALARHANSLKQVIAELSRASSGTDEK